MTVITSSWLHHRHGETLDEPIRAARALGASLMRLHLTPVLEGARARLGSRWTALLAHARAPDSGETTSLLARPLLRSLEVGCLVTLLPLVVLASGALESLP